MPDSNPVLSPVSLSQTPRKDPPPPRTVVLLLPAMTLNATEFPNLGVETLAADYGVLPRPLERDRVAHESGITPYTQGLTAWLKSQPLWQNAGVRLVVAHSFGGMLALDWLTSAQQLRIHGVVLISTSPGPLFEKVLLRLPGVGWRIPLMHFVPVWNTKLVTRVCKRLLSEGSLDAHPVDFQSLRSRSDAAVDRAGWRATEWQQIRALRLALRGFDVRNRLGQLDTRVIILHGTEDALFDLDEAFELERRLPNAHLWIVKGAAHALPLTHPAQVLEAVRSLRHGQEQHPER